MSGLAHVRGEFALELLGPIRGARSVGGDVDLILLGLGGADGTEQGEGSDACGGVCRRKLFMGWSYPRGSCDGFAARSRSSMVGDGVYVSKIGEGNPPHTRAGPGPMFPS